MRDGGKKTKAGQEVRLVDIAADGGKRMGMVEQLNGFATAKELMDTLNRRTSQYYGVAGHAFLQAITQQPDEISQFLKDFKQRFIKANVQQGASEQVLRVASRFALVAAAGEMATDEGITGWPKGEAYKAVVSCFNAWLEGRGGTGNQEVQAIKSQVAPFLKHMVKAVLPIGTIILSRQERSSTAQDLDVSTKMVTFTRYYLKFIATIYVLALMSEQSIRY